MSYVTAIIGGKKKGLADQVTIDPDLGCKNKCIGCYAKKSSQKGKNYDTVIHKDLDKKILKKSIQFVKSKGFQIGRVGKHCDPGDSLDNLNGILDCCNSELFRCVVVSKSLPFVKSIAKKLAQGNHILHISLGPFSFYAPPEEERVKTLLSYKEYGCNTILRLTRDITQQYSEDIPLLVNTIVTPMRYPSNEILRYYYADINNFEFQDGYYRPKVIHPSWLDHFGNVCGEINGEIRCCNCGLNMV